MADLNTANREPVELKIGQVWTGDISVVATIVAVGPEYVAYQISGAIVAAEPGYFRAHYTRHVPAKHVLWVNVNRGDNGEVCLRQQGSRNDADFRAAHIVGGKRIACLKIEFSEGEGL